MLILNCLHFFCVLILDRLQLPSMVLTAVSSIFCSLILALLHSLQMLLLHIRLLSISSLDLTRVFGQKIALFSRKGILHLRNSRFVVALFGQQLRLVRLLSFTHLLEQILNLTVVVIMSALHLRRMLLLSLLLMAFLLLKEGLQSLDLLL